MSLLDKKYSDMTGQEILDLQKMMSKDSAAGKFRGSGSTQGNFFSEFSSSGAEKSREYREAISEAEKSSQATFAGGFQKLVGMAPEIFDMTIKKFDDDFGGMVDNINQIQLAYGNLGSDLNDTSNIAVRAANRYLQLEGAFVNAGDEGRRLTKELGLQSEGITNYFDKFYESGDKMAQKQHDVISLLETQYGHYIKGMDDLTLVKVPAYASALGINSREVAKVLESQIALTGKASTEILDNVAAYAITISEEIDVPAKKLTEFASKMIADTQTFGFVTAEQATKAAASLTQLGFKYEDLSKLQQGFIDFGTSADTAAKLSQIAGVQMDAFELTYIANERPEELVEYLRDQFLSQGFTADRFKSMSKAMQRQLAAAMPGVDFNQVFSLLDTKKPIKDSEDIASSQQKTQESVIETGKAFGKVTKLLSEVEGYTEKSADAYNKLAKESIVPLGKQAYTTARGISTLNSNITSMINLPDLGKEFVPMFESFDSLVGDINTRVSEDGYLIDLGDIITFSEDKTTKAKAGAKDLANSLGGAYDSELRNALSEQMPSSLPIFWQKIVKSIGDPGNYSEFLLPVQDFGFAIGNSFDIGVRSAVEENSFMDLLSSVINPEEGASLINMMDETLSNQVTDEGFALGKDFGMSFIDGIRGLGIADDIKGLTEAIETGITSDSVTQKYEQITNKISEISESNNEKNIALINDILKPIIENVVVELQKLNTSNSDIASRNEVTSVNINGENLIDIVKRGIIRSPEDLEGRAIVIAKTSD